MNQVGIEAIGLYTPKQQMHLETLSSLRKKPVGYFTKSSGHVAMSIPMQHEDVVTMAAEASKNLDCDLSEVRMILFATESSKDQSKSMGIYLHRLLQLRPDCRVLEIKQACYSATAGLQLATSHIQCYPNEKVLLIASDIAYYEPNTIAEGSQGAGAIALLLGNQPKIATISKTSGFTTEDHMDFWRPNHLTYPKVDGRLSCDLYIKLFLRCWDQYTKQSGLSYADHAAFCFHTPLKKLAMNAHRKLLLKNKITPSENMIEQIEKSFLYASHIGNTYSASLLMCFASLLKHSKLDLTHQAVAMYSYGSGCVAECFNLSPCQDYQMAVDNLPSFETLKQRPQLSQDCYLSAIQTTLQANHSVSQGYAFLGHHNDQPIYEHYP